MIHLKLQYSPGNACHFIDAREVYRKLTPAICRATWPYHARPVLIVPDASQSWRKSGNRARRERDLPHRTALHRIAPLELNAARSPNSSAPQPEGSAASGAYLLD